MCRMALTTRKPSPSSPMFRSERRASNCCELISTSASATLDAARTSKPCSSSTGGSVSRILGSSSTNRTRLREGICSALFHSIPGLRVGVYPTPDKNYVQNSTFRERILGKSSTKQASGGLDGALAKCLGSGSQREARRGSLLQRIEGTIRAGDINHFPLNYRRGKNGPRAEELPDPDHHVVVEALGHYD